MGAPTNVFGPPVLGEQVITFYAKKSLAEMLSRYLRGCARRMPRTTDNDMAGKMGLEAWKKEPAWGVGYGLYR